MDSVSRKVLIQKKVKYIGAVGTNRFGDVFDLVKSEVNRPGDIALAFSDSTQEVFTYHWDRDPKIKKKMVMGNALIHHRGKKQPKRSKPLYDEYSVTFSGCDQFNKRLSGCMWPHKKGGRDILGDKEKEDDFSFTCILLNSLFLFDEINNSCTSFESFCIQLADDLYSSTC
jgi:hypothetical protein